MKKNILKGMVLAAMLLTAPAAWTQTPAPPTQEKAPLSDKQKQLLDEANALLKMAAELKVSVDKSNKDQLSLDVVRKAEAVEKAARELKTKLK